MRTKKVGLWILLLLAVACSSEENLMAPETDPKEETPTITLKIEVVHQIGNVYRLYINREERLFVHFDDPPIDGNFNKIVTYLIDVPQIKDWTSYLVIASGDNALMEVTFN